MAIFQRRLRQYRGQILGWGIGLFLLGLMIIPIWESFASQGEELQALMDAYPPELLAFFGGAEISQITTPDGWLSLEYFSIMPIILGIFAVLAGSGLLASDEENGTLDLILAHPISRSELFVGRLLALEVATILILFIAYLGLLLPGIATDYPLSWIEFGRPFVSLFAILMLYGSFALLVSMLLPSRRMAAMVGGLFLVGSYFVTSLARLNESLETLARLSPLNYFEGGDAIFGINWPWVVGLLLVATLFTGLAWWRFEARDIRVGGEGGLVLPWRSARAGRRARA